MKSKSGHGSGVGLSENPGVMEKRTGTAKPGIRRNPGEEGKRTWQHLRRTARPVPSVSTWLPFTRDVVQRKGADRSLRPESRSPNASAPSPSATSAPHAPGRYPGSRVPEGPRDPPEMHGAFPGPKAQWLRCRALLADRCGGSAGIGRVRDHGRPCPTGFPLNPPSRAQRRAPGASTVIVAQADACTRGDANAPPRRLYFGFPTGQVCRKRPGRAVCHPT